MAEEHVLLINEAEEKPEEHVDRHPRPKQKHKPRSPGRWLFGKKLNRLSPSRKKVVITRSKSASTFFSRCQEVFHDICPDLCCLSFNFYCKLVAAFIVILFITLLFTHRQDNSTKYSPRPPVISTQNNKVNNSYNHSISNNRTSLHQIYYNTKNNNSLLVANVSLPACPSEPQNLVGRLKVIQDINDMRDIEFILPNVVIGGHYAPENCTARDRVAIIVPYRCREKHLATLLANLHPMLMRQNIDYTVFIVEQIGNGSFNRAKLFNVGYFEANKMMDFDCYIFHDVDLVPEDDRNLYSCPSQKSPRHMSVAVDKFKYKLPYKTIFGGVCALTKEQMVKVNGFSNEFWGWGGEDDDMYKRIAFQNWKIERYSEEIARYTMLKHEHQAMENSNRFSQLKKTSRLWKLDGLNSCHYKIESLIYKKLYTHIIVDLLHP